jgi:hypothetical protein
MDWNTAASIAEVIGGVAVIVSLVYLATEVRNNTKALKASAGFDGSLQMSELNENLFQAIVGDTEYQQGRESRFANVVRRIYEPEADLDDLQASDLILLLFIHRAIFQKLEGEYYLYQHGFLDATQWEARQTWACSYIELPLVRAWWEDEMKQGIFRPEFIAAISGEIKARLRVQVAAAKRAAGGNSAE